MPRIPDFGEVIDVLADLQRVAFEQTRRNYVDVYLRFAEAGEDDEAEYWLKELVTLEESRDPCGLHYQREWFAEMARQAPSPVPAGILRGVLNDLERARRSARISAPSLAVERINKLILKISAIDTMPLTPEGVRQRIDREIHG